MSSSQNVIPAVKAYQEWKARVRAMYRDQQVTIDVDTVDAGQVDVIGYFGNRWTHGGYAPITRRRVNIADLTDKKLESVS